ncbi:Rieske (2Fe-2S) protein [Roseovarius aestuarii]|uniref:3-phenylpropionate dioxygenase ferredoxin subunit n=1 Tax=Roseovarius aestuarii TaxID=475083 RepID=A0A1X7BYM1_9RHOB|nr:Rieske (2Fe-2S) protein [Roseovarius aestuarii]SMC14683.1 3-phenylpropionate dioxygenase ferredoxin subunit [Roseovarius aestuarii]
MAATYVDISKDARIPSDIAQRTQNGEVFVIRACLQRLGLFEEIEASTIDAITHVTGQETARKLADEGIQFIHKHASLAQIAKITDRAYEIGQGNANKWISQVARNLLGIQNSYYYERTPNIRFHVPYDILAADQETLRKFSGARGGGKLSAHPNHRDSWVGCPDNLINIWAAVAPIKEGNGLIVFPEAFDQDIKHEGASIAHDENPGEPLIPELQAGDAIVFQGDHLHSSVLNRIDETRHAISFRVVTEKPNFSNGHYHHYVHSALASGPFKMFARLPADLAWSYVGTRFGWIGERLGRRARVAAKKQSNVSAKVNKLRAGKRSFRLSDLAEDSLYAITDDVCVARIGQSKVIAFDRKCPHGGSDLSLGTVTNGEVTCPWHNLRFEPKSGASACKSLSNLQMYDVIINGDQVTVSLEKSPAPSSN